MVRFLSRSSDNQVGQSRNARNDPQQAAEEKRPLNFVRLTLPKTTLSHSRPMKKRESTETSKVHFGDALHVPTVQGRDVRSRGDTCRQQRFADAGSLVRLSKPPCPLRVVSRVSGHRVAKSTKNPKKPRPEIGTVAGRHITGVGQPIGQ
jgi:hypothetical protein